VGLIKYIIFVGVLKHYFTLKKSIIQQRCFIFNQRNNSPQSDQTFYTPLDRQKMFPHYFNFAQCYVERTMFFLRLKKHDDEANTHSRAVKLKKFIHGQQIQYHFVASQNTRVIFEIYSVLDHCPPIMALSLNNHLVVEIEGLKYSGGISRIVVVLTVRPEDSF